jgi:diguanylate cyclase (GGDEF)-like protein
MSKLSRAQIFGVALFGVVLVALPDYLAGAEISLSVFYLCPVGIATWYAGRSTGALIAFISALAALAGDMSAGHVFTRIMVWDGLLHLGFMLIVAYLLDRLHTHIEIEHALARSDQLTGIFNRRAFFEHLQHSLDLAAREEKPMVLAYIDLDDFKQINDRSGHDEGDKALRLVARTLTEAVRRTDVVARLGGDEFGVLFAGVDLAGAERLIAKVRHSLLQTLASERSVITCSIGCVVFQTPPSNPDAALMAADALMYKVKSQGKNAVAFEVIDHQSSHPAQPGAAVDAPRAVRRDHGKTARVRRRRS